MDAGRLDILRGETAITFKDREILVTWGEICEFLGVSEDCAKNWRDNYDMPVKRIGNRMVATKRSLIMWVEQKNIPK